MARTSDGHDFAAKWEHEGCGLPASEWLGHRLAQACQIATPFTATLRHNGQQGFGSRIEGDVSSWNTLAPPERATVVAQCSQAMCGLLALDLFVGNEDRHLDNWLFRRNLSGQWVPLCIDFSRPLFRRGFPSDVWPLPQCNTLSTIEMLKAVGQWDGSRAVFAVEQLQRTSPEVLRHWLQECPFPWLPEPDRSALISWWSSPAYPARLLATYVGSAPYRDRLAPVLTDWQSSFRPPVTLLYRPAVRRVPRVRRFIEFLEQTFADQQAQLDSPVPLGMRPHWSKRGYDKTAQAGPIRRPDGDASRRTP